MLYPRAYSGRAPAKESRARSFLLHGLRRENAVLPAWIFSFFLLFYALNLFSFFLSGALSQLPAKKYVLLLLWPLGEYVLFYSLCGILLLRRQRVLFFIFSFAFLSISLIQGVSLIYANSLVSRIALENLNQIGLVWNNAYLIYVSCFLTYFLLGAVHLCAMSKQREKGEGKRGRSTKTYYLLAAGAFIIVALQCSYARLPFFTVERYKLIPPVCSLVKTLYSLFNSGAENIDHAMLTRFAPGKEYPFLKGTVYDGSLPFSASADKNFQCNVIVIFTEGMSARCYACYRNHARAFPDEKRRRVYEDLTPGIDAFAKNAMMAIHYYNHTAATYRGIGGQLTSGYPLSGGSDAMGWVKNHAGLAKRSYSTVPNILSSHGYETVFFSPHKADDPFTSFLGMLGFKKIFAREDQERQFPKTASKLVSSCVSDEAIFSNLTAWLKERAEKKEAQQPFFLGLYNIETHTNWDTAATGVKYRDGSNPALNTIHNFDAQFGKFYAYFKRSPYAANTILILTADHASYPGPAYAAAFGKDKTYTGYFVDAIPLLIYHPSMRLPAVFDAQYATSIAFAPTLLHFLGINEVANSFLGHSLFEKGKKTGRGFAAMGWEEGYVIDKTGVYNKYAVPESLKAPLSSAMEYVKIHQYYESKNKLFPPAAHAPQ